MEHEFDRAAGIVSEPGSGEKATPWQQSSRRRRRAFLRASERLHKNHFAINRTLTLRFILSLLAVIVAALAVRQFIFEPTKVDGTSMANTLKDHERVLVEKLSYLFHEPRRGDIVIVHYPGSQSRYVKRIVGMPGETVSIEDGYVLIDGERLDESAYSDPMWFGCILAEVQTKDGKYTVPQDHYFVIGDKRNNSKDSRNDDVGAIPAHQVLGRAIMVVWPFDSIRSVY